MAQYTTVFSCGCEQEYKSKGTRRTCSIHKAPILTVKSICMNCGESYFPKSMRGAPVFCSYCKSAKEPLLTKEELETCNRIDGWDCQSRSHCLDKACKLNLPELPCKDCKFYIYQPLNIADYITAVDMFNNGLAYIGEGL